MKKTVLVIFGGKSNEHEVSLRSVTTIIPNIDNEKYHVLPLGITREGEWKLYDGNVENITSGEWERLSSSAVVSPDVKHGGIMKLVGSTFKLIKVDVCFPVLHGKNGEDGTIQGLFQMAGIPFVGSDTLSSAVCMDKCITKSVCRDKGIKQAKYLQYNKSDLDDYESVFKEIKTELSFPCFVKPANAGSSLGITKAVNKKTLAAALELAASIDRKIVVEQAVAGREFECAIMGNDEPVASGVGEVLAAGEFYDYESKYDNELTKTIVNPDLPEEKENEMRDVALSVYKALGCKGLARVDFFLDDDENVIFNEINTMPGFTATSMYPMLFERTGLTKRELIDKLINYALE